MSVRQINAASFRDRQGWFHWDSYVIAQRRNGERCVTCGAAILVPQGKPTTCSPCLFLARTDGEASHESRVRCPACATQINPRNTLHDAGEHNFSCTNCGHGFVVYTRVTRSYTSPPLAAESPARGIPHVPATSDNQQTLEEAI